MNGINTWNVTPTINTGHDATSGEHLTRETKTNRPAENDCITVSLATNLVQIRCIPNAKTSTLRTFCGFFSPILSFISPSGHLLFLCFLALELLRSQQPCKGTNSLEWRILICCDWKPLKAQVPYHTVDGRNPAPVDMVNIPFTTFIHVRWCRISAINSTELLSIMFNPQIPRHLFEVAMLWIECRPPSQCLSLTSLGIPATWGATNKKQHDAMSNLAGRITPWKVGYISQSFPTFLFSTRLL